jgi:hypothetical protein
VVHVAKSDDVGHEPFSERYWARRNAAPARLWELLEVDPLSLE